MNKYLYAFLVVLFGCALAASAKKPEQPTSYAYTRGVEAFNNSQYQDALDWFDKELSEHPDNGYAYLHISFIRYFGDEYGRALSAINKAIKLIPKKDKKYKSGSYASRAKIYLAMEDTVSALNDYATAIKVNPENTDVLNYRAQIYFEQGRYDLSDADYQKIIDIDPGDVMGYMGIGRNARNQKRYDEALEKFNYVVRLAPDYSSGYSFRADCYLAQKKYSEAIDDLIKALSINDSKAYYTLMDIDDDALPIAKAKLQVEANKNHNEGMWYYYLGSIYETKRKPLEAIPFYRKAFDCDPASGFLERIANCYFVNGNFADALDYVDQAINMDSNDYDLVRLRGEILNALGRYPEAIAEYDKYVAKYPEYFFGYYRRGWIKDEANDVDGAIDDYTMSITLQPLYPYAYLVRGKHYQQQGKEELAKADFEKVVELDTVPEVGSSCAHHAFFYLGQPDKAVAFMDSIIAQDEDSAGSFYDAACLYSLMDEKEKAIDYLSKAFEKGFYRIADMYADHDLDNIRDLPEYQALIEKYSTSLLDDSDFKSQDDVTTDFVVETVEVPFTKESGVTKVKCTINGLPLHFVFDTGAADVTMSMVEANFMLKNEFISPDDIIGSARYVDANGDISEGTIINLRKVNFGGLELDNVRASVVRNQRAPLLLGQSVLGRLGKIEIDNPGLKLIISHKIPK